MLSQMIGRAVLALAVDLPYALEKPLMRRLLRTPVFEPATPTQLSAVAALPSRFGMSVGDDGMPSMATTATSTNADGGHSSWGLCGGMATRLSAAATSLSGARSEL